MVVEGTGTGDIDTAAISMSNQHATWFGRRVQDGGELRAGLAYEKKDTTCGRGRGRTPDGDA